MSRDLYIASRVRQVATHVAPARNLLFRGGLQEFAADATPARAIPLSPGQRWFFRHHAATVTTSQCPACARLLSSAASPPPSFRNRAPGAASAGGWVMDTARKLSERDVCSKFITPALVAAGWDLHTQIREEVGFTKERIIVRGRLVTRGKAKRADRAVLQAPAAGAMRPARSQLSYRAGRPQSIAGLAAARSSRSGLTQALGFSKVVHCSQ